MIDVPDFMTATFKLCCAAVAILPLLPACAAPPARSKAMETRVVAKAAKPVQLSAAPTTVNLASVSRARSGRPLHLVVRGLRVDEDPGVVYHVYMGRTVVGSINFYGVPPGAGPDRIYYSFDVPKDAGSVVKIVPEAPVAAGAKASIARLELIEE